MKQTQSGVYDDKVTIAILSNLWGEIESVSKLELKKLCDELNQEEIGLMFM